MTTIKLHNTKTRSKEVFEPIDPKNVRMYVCGPTVYDRAHLGNARPVVVFDVLYRLLRHEFGPDHVTYVRNFTDVDDKINAEALRRQKAGSPGSLEALIAERTEETIAWYHADMDALGALRPNHEPRATQFIPQMVAMTQDLIAKGHAYAKDGHVLFRVRSYADYGKLSGRSIDDMIAGARVEVAPFKEDPMDFVLWKPSDADQPGWDSPWGRGRPGWHIECSAMADELLGEHFDIHGGGLDLQFPHHENELAQSSCAHPGAGFANVWMHNEMLQVEGKKMSKSLGNFFTVRDLLDQGIPGEVIRFVLLSTHYSKPMDWTKEKADQAKATLVKWRTLTIASRGSHLVDLDFVQDLANNLSTPLALSRLNEIAEKGNGEALLSAARLLGLLEEGTGGWFEFGKEKTVSDARLLLMFDARNSAREAKDWARADFIRSKLSLLGVGIIDHRGVSAMNQSHRYMTAARFEEAQRLFDAGNTLSLENLISRSAKLGLEITMSEDCPDYYTSIALPRWLEFLEEDIVNTLEELGLNT